MRGSHERGGMVLLVKNYLVPVTASIDTSIEEQTWVKLKCETKTRFGFCYIPPADSQYYSHESFACLQVTLKICDTVCVKSTV